MRARNMMAIGFFSAMAAIGIGNVSDSAASDVNRPDLIEERVGHGGSIYYRQTIAGRTGACVTNQSEAGWVYSPPVAH